MRIIVYGVGAIGGTVAAALTLSGQEVIGIARGAHLEAIRKDGLLLRTPEKTERAHFPCVSDPKEIDFRPDDAILLTMKTQDTPLALQRLRAAGVTTQAVVCAQNGVTNERFALRRFPNVYAMTVILPATYIAAGEVNAFGAPHAGLLDLGYRLDFEGSAFADAEIAWTLSVTLKPSSPMPSTLTFMSVFVTRPDFGHGSVSSGHGSVALS